VPADGATTAVYPTVVTTMDLLDKLYRCVNVRRSVPRIRCDAAPCSPGSLARWLVASQARLFELVSQEIVAMCQTSLRQAATIVARRSVRRFVAAHSDPRRQVFDGARIARMWNNRRRSRI